MYRTIRMLLASIVFAPLIFLQPADAQTARTPAGNAQAMQQMQQLAAERTQLMAENAKLKSELDAAKKERDELKKKQGGADTRLKSSEVAAARAERASATLQTELDREKGRMTELIAKFRETANTLRDVETERATTKSSLAQRDIEFKECVTRNVALYDLNAEILTKLETRSGFGSPLEPFTKLKRVELENLIDGYQTRAEEQRPPTAAR